jgi:glycosyltransferase involved in cell wall biosynthesis
MIPKVSIHVPICNEPPQMVRRTLDALAALDYPDFEVLVVDNNTADPAIWQPVAAHCARLGARFRFFHLGQHPGFKAGALNFALRQTGAEAEIIAVLDADYVVSPDWLAAMVPYFGDALVGLVQSPQDYGDAGESVLERLMFREYRGRNATIQHGTMSLVRRAALVEAGGWGEWTITEEAELGLRLLQAGWRWVYAPKSFGRGVMPDDFAAFRSQRFRRAYGAMQISLRHWRALFSPFCRDLTFGQRWHFVTGWLPWVGDALGLLFLLMWLGWSVGLIMAPMRVEFPIVLFMLPSIGLFGFKLAQILALHRERVDCGLADRLGAALTGLALSHTIGKAVWKGLVIRSAPFLRTPATAHAPALLQGFWMAREEFLLLLLSWAAMAGVAMVQRLATAEAKLWCLVLLTQSVPYLASIAVSVTASLSAKSSRVAARPAGRLAATPPGRLAATPPTRSRD